MATSRFFVVAQREVIATFFTAFGSISDLSLFSMKSRTALLALASSLSRSGTSSARVIVRTAQRPRCDPARHARTTLRATSSGGVARLKANRHPDVTAARFARTASASWFMLLDSYRRPLAPHLHYT